MKILTIFGTRPEAIKMVPVVRALAAASGVQSIVCSTGQHQAMLAPLLEMFDITPDYQLDVMQPGQDLNSLSARLFAQLGPVLDAERPDRVLVHGDTTSAGIAAMAAFHQRIPVAHVEAGLRTGNLQQPWPEEMNRRVVDVIGDLLFAPTAGAASNLRNENLAGRIVVTGNTVIDALHLATARIGADPVLRAQLDAQLPFVASSAAAGRKILLVTGHRRENIGRGFSAICAALARLAARPDISIVYPLHLNPQVRGPVLEQLGGLANVHLVAPLDYLPFVRLMQHAHVVLTDSGGVQEEAPALGKPVLVMRDVTERPEAVAAGTVQLVGTGAARIVAGVNALYDQPHHYATFARNINPYGDGHAAARIVAALTGAPFTEFQPAMPPARSLHHRPLQPAPSTT